MSEQPENTPGPGDRCGPYTLVRRIGEGGMGEVFEAVQHSLKRRVALKLLATWATDSKRHRERFMREGEIAARMRHPNIVEVHDVGSWGQRPYLVMELLEGCSLADTLASRGPVDEPQIAAWMLPVLSAVAAAHDRGVLHRDLKPENIFLAELDSGTTPKILDFGISQVFTQRDADDGDLFYGTPHYMAPEQVSGNHGDARSDQYALGVVLHEMATGRTPFDNPSVTGLLREVRESPYPDGALSEINPTLRAVILRATQRNPEARFADARDMALALSSCAEPESRRFWRARLGASPDGEPTPTTTSTTTACADPPRLSRGKLALLIAALSALVLGGWATFDGEGETTAGAPRSAPRAASRLARGTPNLEASAPASEALDSTRAVGAALDPESPHADPTQIAPPTAPKPGATMDDAGTEAPLAMAPATRPGTRPRPAARGSRRGTDPARPRPSNVPLGSSPWGRAARPAEPLGMRADFLDPWARRPE